MIGAARVAAIILIFFAAACSGSEKKPDENTAGESYVAFAFSEKARTGAFAFSQVSTRAARDEAVAECRKVAGVRKCTPLGAFKSQCGAVAFHLAEDDKRVTPAPGPDASGACQAAEAACARRGDKDCVATQYACREGEPGSCVLLSAANVDQGVADPIPAAASADTQPAVKESETPQSHVSFGSYDDTHGPHGAIALVTANDRVIGFAAYDEPDEATARELAIAGCQEEAGAAGSGCKVRLVFSNACGATASAPRGGFGTGWGDTPALACGWALESCKDSNGAGCRADGYVCSPDDKQGFCDGVITTEDGKTTINGN
jgi:hypothetical protein